MSLIEDDEYEYFFFVTNTALKSEDVVVYFEKRGNSENYIKEAKYNMPMVMFLRGSFKHVKYSSCNN